MTTLKATKRDLSVKAKKLRREGFVTGNLFGREMKESVALQFSALEAEQFVKNNRVGNQITLDLDGEKIAVLVKDVDYNAMQHLVLSIDLQALVAGEKIVAKAQVVLKNEEKIVGYVEQELTEITYKAAPADLVEDIEIDLANYTDCKGIHVKDLDLYNNEKVDVETPADVLVVRFSDHASNVVIEEDDDAPAATVAAAAE